VRSRRRAGGSGRGGSWDAPAPRPAPRTLTRRPAVGAVRVAGVCRLQQLQQPLLVALAITHGRPGGSAGLNPAASRPAATHGRALHSQQ
jgi:hypothetical protein